MYIMRHRWVLTMFLIFVAVSLPVAVAGAQPCSHDGDVNQDGNITPADALLAFQHFLEIIELDGCQQDQANVDDPENSGITPADALCIFQEFLELLSCLTVEITWVEESGLLIATAQYDEVGLLAGYMSYSYFQVTEGSGEIEITAELESSSGEPKGSQTRIFHVEEGQSYKLSVEVECSGPSYDPAHPPTGFPTEFTISFRSPSASSLERKTIQGGCYTNTLSLGQLSLDSWEFTPPQWTLEARVSPKGSGSISDSLGLLVYEGVRPRRGGEYYAGEYEHGTEVTLTATPAPGYVFKEWYGTFWVSNRVSDTSITFTMTIPIFIEARFLED